MSKAKIHTESESHAWTRNIPDHPGRADSPEYIASRKQMVSLTAADSFLGKPPVQDHHGGGLWLNDGDGWFLVKNLAGIEWSAQFCADPAKVDKLRLNARRLYAGFPQAVQNLGIRELLDTPIVDAAGVANWTDSICNASVPLPAAAHTGVLPAGAGCHHYPTPVTDIDFIKRDDFVLWVTDAAGKPVAVTPTDVPGSGVATVQVQYAAPGSSVEPKLRAARKKGVPLVLSSKHPLAKKAFAKQGRKKP